MRIMAEREKRLLGSDIAKIHRQLGHATVSCLRRLLQASGYLFPDQDIYDDIRLCGCGLDDDAVQRPAVSKHLPMTAGDTISMDICYPWNSDRGYPCCVTIDILTRFIPAKFVKKVDQVCIISEFLAGWVQWVGFPKRILVDAGSVCRCYVRGSLQCIWAYRCVFASGCFISDRKG